MKLLLVLIKLLSHADAGIFGLDDRIEAYEAQGVMLERAHSVPALIRSSMLKRLEGGDYLPLGWNMNFCEAERFSEQPHLANCSASLIAPDIVLTAAHCIEEQLGLACDNFKVVFDYAVGGDVELIRAQNVYNCAEVLYYNFDTSLRSHDLALVRLERPVTDRPPVVLAPRLPRLNEPLELIGYPLGLPMKIVVDGTVSSVDGANVSFKHDLDTFSCNSGGPIFDQEGSQVGVLVRGTGPNTTLSQGESCQRWAQTNGVSDYAEGNSLFHLKEKFSELEILLR